METCEVAVILTTDLPTVIEVPSGATSPVVDLPALEATSEVETSEEASHGEAWARIWKDAAATETRLPISTMISEQ